MVFTGGRSRSALFLGEAILVADKARIEQYDCQGERVVALQIVQKRRKRRQEKAVAMRAKMSR